MNEAFLFDYDHEKVMKKTENSIREESYGKGFNKGLTQGKEEGIVEGSREKQIEIAKAMLAKQIDMKIISECTGLSVEELNSF